MKFIFLQIKAQDEPAIEDEANVHLSSSSPSPTNEKLANHIEDHDDDLILPLKKDEDTAVAPVKKEERVTKNVSDVESVSDEEDEGIDTELEGRTMSAEGQQVSFSLSIAKLWYNRNNCFRLIELALPTLEEVTKK